MKINIVYRQTFKEEDYFNGLNYSNIIELHDFIPQLFLDSNSVYIFSNMWLLDEVIDQLGYEVYTSERFIFLNVEQLSHHQRMNQMIRLANKGVHLADCSKSNIDMFNIFFKHKYHITPPKIQLLPYQYNAVENSMMKADKNMVYDFDVGIINATTYKQKKVLESMKTKPWTTTNITYCGTDYEHYILCKQVKKCKIILNIHEFSVFDAFEHLLCDKLIFADKLIISDMSYKQILMDIYPFVIFAEHELIINTTQNVLNNFDKLQHNLECLPKQTVIDDRQNDLITFKSQF